MKLKSKLYKTVVRPAMVYGSECWALQEEQRLHTTEMKMLRVNFTVTDVTFREV